MALTWLHTLTKTNNCDVFVFTNATVYGGSNPARNAAAEYLLAAHITEDGVEEFVEVDSTPYTTKVSYNVSNTLDGHYHFELLRFPIWDDSAYNAEIRDGNNIITTYASVVYGADTQKFYKSILDSIAINPGITAGWETYWVLITDFTDAELRSNTNIEEGIFDNIHDCRSTVCTKNELYKLSCQDGNCSDLKNYIPYLKRAVLLSGARAKNADLQSEKSETILRNLENLCPTCS